MQIDEYQRYDAVGLAALVADGEVQPHELLTCAATLIERYNPHLNAVTVVDVAAAERAAQHVETGASAVAGVPFLMKDSLSGPAHLPMTAGSAYVDGLMRPEESALAARYRAAGLLIMGKTNMPEFGLSAVTEPRHTGLTRNPWDPTITAGGSSGGAAAAVASGIVPVAHGSDGGGSLRIPASCCGVFALKPTRGRTVVGPHVQRLMHGGVVAHVISRSVRDSAALLDIGLERDSNAVFYRPSPTHGFLQGLTAQALPRLRIGVTVAPLMPASVHTDCELAVHRAVRLLEEAGHSIEWAHPDLDSAAAPEALFKAFAVETALLLRRLRQEIGRKPRLRDLEPTTWLIHHIGSALAAPDLVECLQTWDRLAQAMHAYFQRFDVLLTPTLATPPVPHGALQPQGWETLALQLLACWPWRSCIDIATRRMLARAFDFIPFTPMFNMTGHPAMSVPLHWNAANHPIGVQFVGRFGADFTLLQLAAELEVQAPWWDRRPEHAQG